MSPQEVSEIAEALAWQEFLARLDRVLVTPCDCGTCEDCS